LAFLATTLAGAWTGRPRRRRRSTGQNRTREAQAGHINDTVEFALLASSLSPPHMDAPGAVVVRVDVDDDAVLVRKKKIEALESRRKRAIVFLALAGVAWSGVLAALVGISRKPRHWRALRIGRISCHGTLLVSSPCSYSYEALTCDRVFHVTKIDHRGPSLTPSPWIGFMGVAVAAMLLSALGLALAYSHARINRACCATFSAANIKHLILTLPARIKRILKLCWDDVLENDDDDDEDDNVGCAMHSLAEPRSEDEDEAPLGHANNNYAAPTPKSTS